MGTVDHIVFPAEAREEVPGVRLRTVPAPDGTVWNVVEYQAGAVRDDVWCTKGHRGYVLTGTMSYEFRDGGSFSVGHGAGFILGPGRAHRGRNLSDAATQFLIIDDAS
ncbi:hypothetical protein FHS43_006350 [Streptosporangium becharense]|uniref:Cupin domain-containing protein n=1 Tax=Streptosporangium becharense TaxID=1816182 RepID=A0A7W9MF73_9ACTN|nr:hypothetical protein [Streptosporangium becharense]MBB2915035.1 hypothetical protein [Streptosporangium becharense]MBB5818084.1 hypothetical protein [Streptosporangium becharense]